MCIRDRGITSEELFTIVEEAQEEGSIDKEEGSLLRSALSFDDLEAGDILTPRIDMEGIPVESTQEEAAEVFANTGYSRLPVYEETLDPVSYTHLLSDVRRNVAGLCRSLCDRVSAVSVFALVKRQML